MITIYFPGDKASAELPDVVKVEWHNKAHANPGLSCYNAEGKEVAHFLAKEMAGFYLHEKSRKPSSRMVTS